MQEEERVQLLYISDITAQPSYTGRSLLEKRGWSTQRTQRRKDAKGIKRKTVFLFDSFAFFAFFAFRSPATITDCCEMRSV